MSAQPNCSLAESIASLPESERIEALEGLTEDQAQSILYDWRGMWARPNQLPPAGSWEFWLLLAGRGFGKTKTGAETVREWASEPLPAPIHIIAPTSADVRTVMIEGPSGLLSCYPAGAAPIYEPTRRKITWPNGNVAITFSADEPERLRGPQCCRFWADELAAWRYPEEAWDNLMFGFRIGDDLRGVITTTPKPIKLLKAILQDRGTVVTRGSTYDNRGNLSPKFFSNVVKKYEGTRLGRQELNAEILDDVPGALWKRSMIDATRIRFETIQWDKVFRTVVAIDPSVTHTEESDECGIVIAALLRSGHSLILDDLSCNETALEWAKIAVAAFFSRRADRIIGEVNNGGDLVETTLRIVNPAIPFKAVWASKGKAVRAEPVSALYEKGLVHHVGSFGTLEDEMCNYVPGVTEKSPNRMDALVWALTELYGLDGQEEKDSLIVNPAGSYQISPI